MDHIYLDRPSEKLDVKQIQALNAVRLPLMGGPANATNTVVRESLAHAVSDAGSTRVLEWGCGYHSMQGLMRGAEMYAAIDADPQVVAWQRRVGDAGSVFYQADADLPRIPTGCFQAVISSFVFHFRIPRRHILAMRRALTHDGYILANVYRRSARSRRELAAEFNQAGFHIRALPDPFKLCADHEYWHIAKTRTSSGDRRDPLRLLAGRLRGPANTTENPRTTSP